MKKIRFGILGTAVIARKNWKAIHNSGNAIITAVASRDIARSRKFITEFQREARFPVTPTAFGSYEELIASPDVDAVYIPLPTGLRKKWVLRAAKAGKHVICEKPCAADLPELQEMISACQRNRVQFMDGVMFMHSKRLALLRKTLDDGKSVGKIKRIATQLSFNAPDDFLRGNIRMQSSLEPHGCLGDLGWYCIRFTLWAMNWQTPRRVRANILSQAGTKNSKGTVPTEFSAELFFDKDTSASFYCSFITENQAWANVSGTKGYLRVNDFVLPFLGDKLSFEVFNSKFAVRGCDFEMTCGSQHLSVKEHANSARDSQETNLFRNFAAQVQTGKLNKDWPMWSLKTQQVMEACFTSARKGREVKL